MRIFGISKSKTLSEFVTTEQDVKKGNNRLPLNLARLYEEDLMTDEDVEKAMVEMKMQGMKIVSLADSQGENLFVQEDLMKVAETRNHAMRRQSEVQKKPAAKPNEDHVFEVPRDGGSVDLSSKCRQTVIVNLNEHFN